MISKETIEELEKEERGWEYILGARMRYAERGQGRGPGPGRSLSGRASPAHYQRRPAPLKVKEVRVEGRRYIVCLNDDEARKDAADREAIVASLREKLRTGEKSLVGNKGYRRYLNSTGADHFQVDEAKIEEEARYDGKWVLRTNTDLEYSRGGAAVQAVMDGGGLVPLDQVAVADSADLSQVRRNDPWSRLLLVPGVGAAQELEVRLAKDGHDFEWADVIQDLDRLQMVEVEQDGKRFLLRSEVQGTCGTVFRAAGVAVPPTVQQAPKDPADLDRNPSATPRM